MAKCRSFAVSFLLSLDIWHIYVYRSFRYLYILYLAIDANFKLKGKDRKISDIELAPGLGAFVNETQYQDFIKDYVDQPEVNLWLLL
jgi:hypothetical protein